MIATRSPDLDAGRDQALGQGADLGEELRAGDIDPPPVLPPARTPRGRGRSRPLRAGRSERLPSVVAGTSGGTAMSFTRPPWDDHAPRSEPYPAAPARRRAGRAGASRRRCPTMAPMADVHRAAARSTSPTTSYIDAPPARIAARGGRPAQPRDLVAAPGADAWSRDRGRQGPALDRRTARSSGTHGDLGRAVLGGRDRPPLRARRCAARPRPRTWALRHVLRWKAAVARLKDSLEQRRCSLRSMADRTESSIVHRRPARRGPGRDRRLRRLPGLGR